MRDKFAVAKPALSVYTSLHHIMAARTAGIDRSDEITSLSPYVSRVCKSALGRWRSRKAAADGGCGGWVSARLAAFGEVEREDLVKLLAIYDDDMKLFGYTWNESRLTARCGAKTGRSPASNATERYCC